VNWKLPESWKLPDWRSLDRRQLYTITGVAVPFVIVAGLLVLWVAGAFGGGGDGEEQVTCSPCPGATATRSPRPTRSPSPSPSPSPCCTPPADTFAPTAPPTQPPTAPPTQPPAPVPQTYGLVPYLSSGAFSRVVDFAIVPGTGNTEAIAVLQKDERILRVSLIGAFEPQLYGDLSNYVGGGGNEEGLLSATFSPDFQNDGRIYVYYTQGAPAPTVLSRFQVRGGAMNTGTETRILEVPDFASNHNGGRILFGPDGYLYLSLGDGGGGGDPRENGQNVDSLLGKVLRLNVTGQDRYSIPADNPFVGGGGLDEIWAYGFRNPWRFGFDRATGALWLGDVGQGTFEEVDLVVKGGNYGWDCYEGPVPFEPDGCPGEGFQMPRAAYGTHDFGSCAVTGGYVYRGGALPQLNGRYIFADYCSGIIWALDSGNPSAQPVMLLDSDQQISSFYELPDGELLVLTFGGTILLLAR
jgi:glucose/arabinose dehydrogenase